jgi:hypothetical protein
MGDPDPDFFNDFGRDLVEQPALKSAGTTSIDFDGLLSPPLKLHEDLTNGCGGQLWPAGMVLAKYMLRTHRNTLKGKKMFVRSDQRMAGWRVLMISPPELSLGPVEAWSG